MERRRARAGSTKTAVSPRASARRTDLRGCHFVRQQLGQRCALYPGRWVAVLHGLRWCIELLVRLLNAPRPWAQARQTGAPSLLTPNRYTRRLVEGEISTKSMSAFATRRCCRPKRQLGRLLADRRCLYRWLCDSSNQSGIGSQFSLTLRAVRRAVSSMRDSLSRPSAYAAPPCFRISSRICGSVAIIAS